MGVGITCDLLENGPKHILQKPVLMSILIKLHQFREIHTSHLMFALQRMYNMQF